MSNPTIAQCAGRALMLLLQHDTKGAIEELERHKLDFVDGAPELIEENLPVVQRDEVDDCQVTDCGDLTEYEGWVRKLDPFTQEPIGMNQKFRTCEEHKMLLIGFQKENEHGS